MKQYIALVIALLSCAATSAQSKTYDIVTYTRPKGWKEAAGTGFMSYSRVDGGSWAQLAIYGKTASAGDAETDFNKAWQELVATPHNLTAAPVKGAPDTVNGWMVVSGSGSWLFNGAAVASVLTVYSNNQVCVSLLCNVTAKPYLKDYQQLMATLKLAPDRGPTVTPAAPAANAPTGASNTGAGIHAARLAGVWEFYRNETSGSLITGGYFRREYRLHANGTYEYLTKSFSAYNPVISLGRETGTWSVSNDRLTIRPAQGKNEEWSKSASGRNTEWGKLIKTTARKLETVTYSVALTYLSGMDKTYLQLTAQGPTVRDGRESNNDKGLHQFFYTPGTPGKPLIDLPPGRQ